MSETPRLRSAFPQTPRTNFRQRTYNSNDAPVFSARKSFSPASNRPSPIHRPIQALRAQSQSQTQNGGPVIPLSLADAPTQRFYVAAFYIALTAWRIYNSWHVQDDLDSTWLFLKWIGIDAAFLIALPACRIPWLEFSFVTTVTLWVLHVVANAFLMYKIPIPLLAWFLAFTRLFYDRELSISEHRVKPADILHNSSIILGKQIIQILPEGSAILNPAKQSYCLGPHSPSVEIPIQINQTTPISIELLRYDLETDEEETIVISGKQARQLKRQADKLHAKIETNTPRMLRFPVSKTGLYRLERVIDESKLEVRRRSHDVAIVKCPQASMSAASTDRCFGDLSRVSLEVTGVPPFKVKYSKRIKHHQYTSTVQSIQPADDSADTGQYDESGIVLDPRKPQKGWTQSKTVSVDINEALNQNGSWTYMIEEVEDGLANKVIYDVDKTNEMANGHRVQGLSVHNRPVIDLVGCDSEHALAVAEGKSVEWPIRIRPLGQLHPSDWPLKLHYAFIPEGSTEASEEYVHEIAADHSRPQITKAGKYVVKSIDSQFCHGEVVEPSSCSLYNPPRPGLAVDHEDLFDKCAGSPIGMLVNLDFTGTPPFDVRYSITHKGSAMPKVQRFHSMRGQLEFRERAAGSYIYQIHEMRDSIYDPKSLKDQNLVFKQDIKPPASAFFMDNDKVSEVCLGDKVGFTVKLLEEGPWDLDYEIIHGGKRKKYSVHSEQDSYMIMLPEQSDGGKYTIVLTGIQDKTKCKIPLKEERQVQIRPERPTGSFGDIDGKRSISILEDKSVNLPLRLKGRSPWSVRVQNINDGSAAVQHTLTEPNGVVKVRGPGTYELVSVHDNCPGIVDPKLNKFTISTIARPSLEVKDNSVRTDGQRVFVKPAVCQGEEASITMALTGNAPFDVKYQQKFEPNKGPAAISNKHLSLASSSLVINMDTSKAGRYSYVVNELRDELYSHERRHFAPITIRHEVYAPPSAKFSNAGKTYGYCKADPSFTGGPKAETEEIPITFAGTPPFSVEIAVLHHGVSTRPEIIRVKDIATNAYSWSISRSSLDLGTHIISLRSVRDGRGCESIIDQDSSSVRIAVSSPPTIIPLESAIDYCVGEHVSFSLSGQAPFEVFYNFQNKERKARVTSNEFKRIAESPGEFVITGVSDSAMGSGKCRARKDIRKNIRPYPTVKISQGRTLVSDIHEGGEVDILFEFTGTPPFEFTYTRSENVRKGQKARVLETRHDSSDEYSKTIRASDEGTYEVVAIKDRYCAYASPNHAAAKGTKMQKLLQY